MHRSLLAFCFVLCGLVPAQTQLPSGFSEDTLATGLDLPVGFSFLPDGRILVAEQRTGAIKLRTETGVATIATVANLNLVQSDRGVQGLVVDPAWPQWPYVYVHYTHAAGQVHVTRYTASGDLSDPASANLSLGSPKTIITSPDTHPFHNGGCLRFGPDGMLYLSFGDDVHPCDAQNLESLRGVVLRIDITPLHGDTTATAPATSLIAPAGNPFSGPNAQLVWCHGLRNPFRFNIDELSGNLYVADVGNGSREALYESSGGENFGWPFVEGTLPFTTCSGITPTLTDPIAEYPHLMFSYQTIISMGRFRSAAHRPLGFGASHDGNVFYIDYYHGEIKRLVEQNGSWIPAPAIAGQPTADSWATGLDSVTDAQWGPDGALYYTSHQGGALRRIRGAASLVPVQGQGMPVNAGTSTLRPLIVRLDDADGQPVSGATVEFRILSGDATLQGGVEISNGSGEAHCDLTMGTTPQDLVVEASCHGLTTSFTLPWRGLVITHDPQTQTYTATVHHSEAHAPITFASDLPGATSLSLPFGTIATSILSPSSTLGLIDGMGLLLQPQPSAVTDAQGVWSLGSPPIPASLNRTVVFQAYAIDDLLHPDLSAFLISNPVSISF